MDRAIMRKPPRPKNAPILTARLFARVIFSASIIVVGTLFMYLQQTIDDGGLSRRDQTMVSPFVSTSSPRVSSLLRLLASL